MNLRIYLFGLVLFLHGALSARAQWTVTSAKNEPGPNAGVLHRQVQLKDAAGETATVELALFSAKSCALKVIDNPGGSNDLAQAVAPGNFLAGVNGGYFDPNFAPLGLRVIDGHTVSPVIRARLMTGIVGSTRDGIQILRVGEYSSKRAFLSAVQCGPLLVDGGQAVKGLNKTRPARRTFVALGGGRAALGLCTEVSLAEMGNILSTATLADGWKISRALNLDGGSSSAFWFKRSNGNPFSISEFKNVRDFIALAPK